MGPSRIRSRAPDLLAAIRLTRRHQKPRHMRLAPCPSIGCLHLLDWLKAKPLRPVAGSSPCGCPRASLEQRSPATRSRRSRSPISSLGGHLRWNERVRILANILDRYFHTDWAAKCNLRKHRLSSDSEPRFILTGSTLASSGGQYKEHQDCSGADTGNYQFSAAGSLQLGIPSGW